MTRRPPRALIIGGSLGGLFTANLLHRDGWDVHVYEQSPVPLAGRGAGIIPHPGLFAALESIGIAIDASFGVDIPLRVTFDRSGAVVGTLAMPQKLTTWGRLHELLMSAFPASRYHYGCALERIDARADAVTATFADGSTACGELLVGADGIRSTVRAHLLPEAKPRYVGYLGWRGLADESALSPKVHDALFPLFAFCLPEREQMLGYPVAGHSGSTRPGERCYNFVWYRPADEMTTLRELCTDGAGLCHGSSIPPPLIRAAVRESMLRAADETLSPQFVEVVRRARQPFFQPIYDVESSHMAFGRVALMGDAAFVARPHCGMGVTKGAGDAMALAGWLRAASNEVVSALRAYESERLRFGASVVAHGRELGAYLEGDTSVAAASHHTQEAVMREIAVDRPY
ncbi:MAG TPA: FAD binding domain-containing protein [Burkholderiales bacterium]|nr:FAD binding domain-containing protein [Burkholderiales bacterium]